MRLQEIIDIIKKIGGSQPNVNSSTEGSIYEVLNTNPSIDYANFHITQNKHTSNNQFITYNFILFYTDRLMDDKSNKLQIQSIGIEVLSNVLRTIQTYYEDAEVLNTDFQPFTERFSDNCAGVFSNVSVIFPIEYTCEEMFANSISTDSGKCEIRNEYVTVNVTENGQLTVNYGPNYTGLERVVINTNVPQLDANLGLKTVTITNNGITYLRPEDDDLDGYDEVRVITQIPQTGTTIRNQNKTLNASNNGSYTIKADNGYTGLGNVTVNVNVPLTECDEFETENITITENGTYRPTKDGFDRVVVNVPQEIITGDTINNQNKSVKITSNGTTQVTFDRGYTGLGVVSINADIEQQTFETENITITENGIYTPTKDGFDRVIVNVAQTGGTVSDEFGLIVENGNGLFKYNPQSPISVGNIKIVNGDAKSMFYNCNKLTKVGEYIEIYVPTSNVAPSIDNMFYGCSALNINKLYITTESITSLTNMFGYCTSLTSLDLSDWNVSNVIDMRYVFVAASNLHTLNLSGWDFSGLDYDDNHSMQGMFSNTSLTNLILDGARLPKMNLDNLGLEDCNLTVDSLMGIINALPTVEVGEVPYYPLDLGIGATNIAKLTPEQISIATNKGWSLE